MALFDSLCGVTSAHSSDIIYAIGSGLSASTTYYLFTTSANPLLDVDTGNTATTNGNGNLVFQLSQGTASFTYWLHSAPATPIANRVANALPLAWGAGFAVPSYGTPAVLDSAIGGDTVIALDWTAAFGCDARLSTLTYAVRSSSSAPPPNPASTIASGLTVTNYTATGIVNGTTHWYMIRATFKYLDDLITPTGPYDSNVLSGTATAHREYWGHIVQP